MHFTVEATMAATPGRLLNKECLSQTLLGKKEGKSLGFKKNSQAQDRHQRVARCLASQSEGSETKVDPSFRRSQDSKFYSIGKGQGLEWSNVCIWAILFQDTQGDEAGRR